MMDCTKAQAQFSALLDGEVTPIQRAAVEAHLSQCTECLRMLEGYRRVSALYGALAKVPAPAEFEERLRARVASKMAWIRQLRRRPLVPLLTAAAVLALSVAGWLQLDVGTQRADRLLMSSQVAYERAPDPRDSIASFAEPRDGAPAPEKVHRAAADLERDYGDETRGFGGGFGGGGFGGRVAPVAPPARSEAARGMAPRAPAPDTVEAPETPVTGFFLAEPEDAADMADAFSRARTELGVTPPSAFSAGAPRKHAEPDAPMEVPNRELLHQRAEIVVSGQEASAGARVTTNRTAGLPSIGHEPVALPPAVAPPPPPPMPPMPMQAREPFA
jgi:hypothetical protein